ncbi:MAPK-activated protein kinase Srk1 [Exophiala xenobiotica]|nr:MAPK-activated protein kinase Srk1 [Exophiala xenobiotica]KAK5356128.1 MAPK-activated protein kinase Srk1 [Exophiala xenobiotica]
MDDLNIFLTLTPFDEWGLTIDSFRLPHNAGRYVKPSPISRGTTPSEYGQDETPASQLEDFHRIQLRFNQKTKVKGRITFGSDPDQCDVLLESTRPRFYVSFDSEQRPAIWDDSNNGLTVSYDGQGKNDLRNHFKWIFFPEYETIRVKIPLRNKRELALKVHLPQHYETHPTEYENNVKRFMANSPPPHEAAFHNLGFHSLGTSFAPSESLSPTKRPVYLKREELGSGAYGRVRRILDATTGLQYAGKEFFHSIGWEREIEILKELRHDHVVRFLDFKRDPKPLLVMEYLPLGNLQHQNTSSQIAVEEWSTLLHQCLTALAYLHARKVTHRDLKPENILIHSRIPFWVRVGDFGLAKKGEDLSTFCGNYRYSPPEAYSNQPCTSRVDIWQLGVIVMEGLYGLPVDPRPKKPDDRGKIQQHAFNWCKIIIDAAADWESDVMIDFLRRYLLKWKATDRRSATECLNTAIGIGLFDEYPLQTGTSTPRPKSSQTPARIDAEDASTLRVFSGTNVDTRLGHDGRTLQSPELLRQLSPQANGLSGSAERHSKRSVKKRRTTNDFDPSLSFSDSAWPLDGEILYRAASSSSQEACSEDVDQTGEMASGHPQLHPQLHPQALGQPKSVPPRVHRYHVKKGFSSLIFFGKTIFFRNTDYWINATQLLQAAGYDRHHLPLDWRVQTFKYEMIIGPGSAQGTYVPMRVGIEICKRYGSADLVSLLEERFPLKEDNVTIKQSNPKKDDFEMLKFDDYLLSMRKSDHYVNLTHICSAAQQPRSHLQKWKTTCGLALNVVRGNLKVQGSYADISTAIKFAQSLGLSTIAETLLQLMSTLAQDHGERNDPVIDGLFLNQTTTVTPMDRHVSKTLLPGRRIDNRAGSTESDSPEGDSVIYTRLDISRPSFRFMTPSDASQNAKLCIHLDNPEARTPSMECTRLSPREYSTVRTGPNERRLRSRTVESPSNRLLDTFASGEVGQSLQKGISTGSFTTAQSQNKPHSKCS